MPVPTMPANAAAAAAPPPRRYTLRRALTSVRPASAVAVDRPGAAEAARAGEGSNAVTASAAPAAMTGARQIDKHTAFRANISKSPNVPQPAKPGILTGELAPGSLPPVGR